ncbi:MAG: hypothetical protein CM15mP74_35450 [Halieaceae bacterium]|nr:MAG: hypothetical protein CM15mP74_35450 [Halieaceae bacterium]
MYFSVDTSTPSIMTASGRLGAGLLNDVRGFRRPGALESAAGTGLAMCLMHMQGEPDTMQHDPSYDDVITDLDVFFDAQLDRLQAAGYREIASLSTPGSDSEKQPSRISKCWPDSANWPPNGFPYWSGCLVNL